MHALAGEIGARFSEQPEIILDGAHNLAWHARPLRLHPGFYAGRKIWMVYGVMRDKDLPP